ncbi:MAG: hypothetical protein U0Z53_09530 [Blastocatellia bacterium]
MNLEVLPQSGVNPVVFLGEALSIEASLQEESGSSWQATLRSENQKLSPASQEEFTAEVAIEIPGANVSIPKQNFVFRFFDADHQVMMKSQPTNSWPIIFVEMKADPFGIFHVKQFRVYPSANTAAAEIKYTRFQLSLSRQGACLFDIGLEEKLRFSFSPLTPKDENQLLHRASLFRKLAFLEERFRCRFRYPAHISANDVFQIDCLFRGLTEGEFTTRLESISMLVYPSEVDLSKPPYNGPGLIQDIVNVNGQESLFDQILDVGPVIIRVEKAELSDPQSLRLLREKGTQPVKVRFDILDHQLDMRFDRYAQRSCKELGRKLNWFVYSLSREESKEIAGLTSERLLEDVSADEAVQIAVGWLNYNQMPDRFCPQEPKLDSSAKHWRVPIWLVYSSGAGGEVGELLINIKTGKILSPLPAEELRSRGQSLAGKIFHASETTPIPTGD